MGKRTGNPVHIPNPAQERPKLLSYGKVDGRTHCSKALYPSKHLKRHGGSGLRLGDLETVQASNNPCKDCVRIATTYAKHLASAKEFGQRVNCL